MTLDGSIIRVDPDTGDAMPDNPAVGDANANRRRIVAYGFRNPFRFTFRPGTSEVWIGDVGWNTWEEVNRVRPDSTDGPQLRLALLRGRRRGSPPTTRSNVDLCESLYARRHGQPRRASPYNHGADVRRPA